MATRYLQKWTHEKNIDGEFSISEIISSIDLALIDVFWGIIDKIIFSSPIIFLRSANRA